MTRSLRVLALDHSAAFGGGELALSRAIEAISPGEVSPRVLLFEHGPLVERLGAAGVPVEVLPLGRAGTVDRVRAGRAGMLVLVPSMAVFVLRLARRIRALRPDVVHTNTLKADLLGWAAARLARVPVVWWVHDRIADDYLPARTAWLFRWAATHLPDAVIANSEASAATLTNRRGARPPVAYPGFAAGQVRADALQRSEPIDPVVGLVGRISPTKGQVEFLDAAAVVRGRYPRARFVVAGAPLFGAEDYADRVRARVGELGLDEEVALTGHVDDVPALLDGLSVMVHASPVPEPFGQVVVEAMVRGVPVVATDAGGVPEILVDPDNGQALGELVAPGDARALAEGILRLLDDPLRAQAQAARAYRSVESRFAATQTARVLTDVWRGVARD
ncbi:glycosyltransferase [Xylanimonas protaetiae]|uniref:glycosyltransferase n=1 Tax=Xylanimonas protaetiae TaxID=2509457 RepID=UPI0013EE1C17|nr:glycosyltransferase [Xylanimonas protaetiae]